VVRCALFIFITILVSLRLEATHIRAADIRVRAICESPRTFEITVVAYLNTTSNTRFGTNGQLLFGDGLSARIPVSTAISRPDLGSNIAIATYTTTHTYSLVGTYRITYIERDRSTGVLNIDNSHDVAYVTNITIDVSSRFACNNFPVLAVPPLDRACHWSTFYHTSGAYDVDGDSLSYELAVPLSGETTNSAYTPPNLAKFYTDPLHGNEGKTGPATFGIDQLSGLLTWDAPGLIGEYNIAFRIIEWRKDPTSNRYDKISTTTRDMQIVVEECQNTRPELTVPRDTCVVAGASLDVFVKGFDADGNVMRIETYSEIRDFPVGKNPAVITAAGPSNGPDPIRLTWTTLCAHVRQQPYQVVFKVTDYPPNGPKLVNFKIWNIRVIAPPPVQAPVELDLVVRTAALSWEGYGCDNADKLQVWRKVGSYPGAAGYCDIRSPALWGYKLIAELPTTSTSFVDDNFGRGLSVGAMYCYRIVAAFADTRSYPSQEFCVGPIQADAPVITHVSVEQTAEEGKIRVSWRKPFGINKTQFPEPYEFEVFRANDFIGEEGITLAGRTGDTTLLDVAVNTEEKVFNYRVVLYGKPQNASVVVAIDTSAVASSVWLSAKPGEGLIELNWRDSVPWSNVIDSNPWHRIYRSADNPSPGAMVLIDSVNVTVEGFKYIDRGRYNEMPVEEDKYYSYRVMTRGTYGNPQIKLLENFSQITSSYPANDLEPCAPVITVSLLDCEQYIASDNCGQTEFTNRIFWTTSGLTGCRRDIQYYNVYASSSRDGIYGLVATQVVDTFYIDSGLPSYARCYRVSSVDKLGKEGVMSDSVCNDNCPSYMLPNVFSPNEDGHNDTFQARFKPGSVLGEFTCPRFVLGIDLHIYDRWGKQIYRRVLDPEETAVEFEWDGRDNNGGEVPVGIYFYSADVTFDLLDNSNRIHQYKGWVQLMR
jgi:gliding motility-associated-like protein